jgi:hypothetical protein
MKQNIILLSLCLSASSLFAQNSSSEKANSSPTIIKSLTTNVYAPLNPYFSSLQLSHQYWIKNKGFEFETSVAYIFREVPIFGLSKQILNYNTNGFQGTLQAKFYLPKYPIYFGTVLKYRYTQNNFSAYTNGVAQKYKYTQNARGFEFVLGGKRFLSPKFFVEPAITSGIRTATFHLNDKETYGSVLSNFNGISTNLGESNYLDIQPTAAFYLKLGYVIGEK